MSKKARAGGSSPNSIGAHSSQKLSFSYHSLAIIIPQYQSFYPGIMNFLHHLGLYPPLLDKTVFRIVSHLGQQKTVVR